MSDREILEKAEARILVPSYYATVKKIGKKEAAFWLMKQIRNIERHYGQGFERRVRTYMREVDNEELIND
jgi:Tfp pilus assembly protein PilE